ncbi:MAG: murein biosynthesis integral membrane protein MurJ [Oscillochloris sp.]|nr:murein biosynthesis integral membrane protein MurJ [Oscillochloris sp.]
MRTSLPPGRKHPAAARVLNLAMTALLGVAGLLSIVGMLAAGLFVRTLLAPGLDPATQALTATLARIMLLEVLLVVAESGLVALLVSRNQLLLPAMATGLHNLALIGGIGVAILVPDVGIYGPTIGAIVDALIKLAILIPGLQQRGYRFQLLWRPRDRDLHTVLRLLIPNALSSGVNYAGTITDTALSTLAGHAAALGAIQNAYLLVGLPIRLLGVAIGQATMPHMVKLSIAKQYAALRKAVHRALAIACGLAGLAAIAMIGLGRLMIRLLFERGAFDSYAGDLTYQMLAAYSLGLPAYVATEVLARALLSCLDTRTQLLTNSLQLTLRITLLLAMIGQVGPVLIPLAFAASSVIEAGILYIVLQRRIQEV